MAQAPSYMAPQTTQILAPDIAAQQLQLVRQQQMADTLRQQSLEPMPQGHMVGQYYAAPSWTQGLAKVLQGYMAKKSQGEIDSKSLDLSKTMGDRMGALFGGGTTSPDAASSASMTQGALQQPSAPDASGQPVNQGGVGPTNSNAVRMGQMLAQGSGAAPQGGGLTLPGMNPKMAMTAYAMDPSAYMGSYLKQFDPTDMQKNDRYLQITADQSRASELAKRDKEGYIPPTRLGEGAYFDSKNGVSGLPTAAPAGFINERGPDGQWATKPVAGGVSANQVAQQAKTLGTTLGTLNQGVDDSGAPTYFLGLPPGVSGAPPATNAPAATIPQGSPAGKTPLTLPGDADKAQIFDQTTKTLQGNLDKAKASGDPQAIARANADIDSFTSEVNRTSGAPTNLGQRGGIRPGNAPGFNEYQTSLASAAGKRSTDLTAQASDSPTRIGVLDNILNLSKSGVSTGPTAEWTNKAKGYAADALNIKGWKDDVSGYQEMNKFLAQNAQRAWQAAGGTGTDAQLEAATNANMQHKMFPQALQAMATWAKAGELALQGKSTAQQNASLTTPQAQQQFESTWRQNLDPRLFQIKLMAPADAQAYVSILKTKNPADYDALMKKAGVLKQLGGL